MPLQVPQARLQPLPAEMPYTDLRGNWEARRAQQKIMQEQAAVKNIFATTPNQDEAIAKVMQINPTLGQQFQEKKTAADLRKAQMMGFLDTHKTTLLEIDKLDDEIKSKKLDTATGMLKNIVDLPDTDAGIKADRYEVFKKVAPGLGVEAPQQYDPNWANQLIAKSAGRTKLVAEEIKKTSGGSGGLSGWKERKSDFEKIKELPPEEQDAALNDFLMTWAPSVGYAASPESIEQAKKKQGALIPGKIQEAVGKKIGTQAVEPITQGAAKDVDLIAQGIQGANQFLKTFKEKGTSYFDVTSAGQFTNPDAANAVNLMVESIGRLNSGAAITEPEWLQFRKLTANPMFLTTAEGKKTLLNNLRRFTENGKARASMLTKNTSAEDWQKTYKIEDVELPGAKDLSTEEKKAVDWAKKNPNDKRAITILKLYGM